MKVLVTNTYLTDIANAIRNKNGEAVSYKPSEMAAAIDAIKGETKIVITDSDDSWQTEAVKRLDVSARTNMAHMFQYANGSYDVSEFDTSNCTTMLGMFQNAALASLDISSFDTSKVTDVSSMFAGNSLLNHCVLSGVNLSAALRMDGMFSGCSGLRTLDMTRLNTINAQNLSSMFNDCSLLQTIDLSDFKTSSATNMARMFANCSSLTELDLSSFNTSHVTDMSYMFNYCSKLATLDIKSFDTSSVKSMANMFNGVGTKILDLGGWDVREVTTLQRTFASPNIKTLDLSGWDTSNVTNMQQALQIGASIPSTQTVKIWLPSTFVATKVTSDYYKPMRYSGRAITSGGVDVYTDAPDSDTQGWGTITDDFKMHYNATHDEFLAA